MNSSLNQAEADGTGMGKSESKSNLANQSVVRNVFPWITGCL